MGIFEAEKPKRKKQHMSNFESNIKSDTVEYENSMRATYGVGPSDAEKPRKRKIKSNESANSKKKLASLINSGRSRGGQ